MMLEVTEMTASWWARDRWSHSIPNLPGPSMAMSILRNLKPRVIFMHPIWVQLGEHDLTHFETCFSIFSQVPHSWTSVDMSALELQRVDDYTFNMAHALNFNELSVLLIPCFSLWFAPVMIFPRLEARYMQNLTECELLVDTENIKQIINPRGTTAKWLGSQFPWARAPKGTKSTACYAQLLSGLA